MTNKECEFGELELTEERRKDAWNYISDMQSVISEISAGKQLIELFKNSDLTLGQKIYIAYVFGRIEDKYRGYLNVVSDTTNMMTQERHHEKNYIRND